jgi:very-short-patch-repair endonuclease
LKWNCPNGHCWSSKWRNIQAGKGCPYCKKKNETRVGNWLQQKFPEVRSQFQFQCPKEIRKSGKIFVDFFIPELNLVVEYHGIQHYKYIPNIHRTEIRFREQVARDSWLRTHCQETGLNYLEVPYSIKDLEEFLEVNVKIIGRMPFEMGKWRFVWYQK